MCDPHDPGPVPAELAEGNTIVEATAHLEVEASGPSWRAVLSCSRVHCNYRIDREWFTAADLTAFVVHLDTHNRFNV